MPTSTAAPATIVSNGTVDITGTIIAGDGNISIESAGILTITGDVTNGTGGFTIGSSSKKRALAPGATNIPVRSINTTGPATIVHNGSLTVMDHIRMLL